MKLFEHYPHLKTIRTMARRRKLAVHLVGGFLRDYLLKRTKLDFDFAVERNAVEFARNFAETIHGGFVLLDEEHGCGRVVKKQDGTLITFDFADFRAPSLTEDCAHRDFTINTLSLDITNAPDDAVIDDLIVDTKRGLKDIRDRRIKRTSVRALREDPLRILRAFSLKAQLDFKIELTTLNQIRKEAAAIRTVSYERIREEFFKILESDRAAETLKSMDKAGLLEAVIPQIRVMYDCPQGGYHHLDVWPHSLETVVQIERVFYQLRHHADVQQYIHEPLAGTRSRKAMIKLGCLLHDIGKPETRRIENDRMSFHGHEHVGKHIVHHIAKMLILSTHERHVLEDLVQMHLRPGYLSNFKTPGERMIFRFFRDAKEETVSILLLSLADQRATRGPLTSEEDQKHHEAICLDLMERWFAKQKEEPFVPLINGHDLIKILKLKPSPLFAKILSAVEEQQVLGKISSREEALALAEKYIEKKKTSSTKDH